MTFFFETLLGGLLAGTMYSLVAIGFVLIYKASGVFNFAQGAMLLFAALTFVSLHDQGVPFALALLLTVMVMIVGALLIERLVLRPLVNRSQITLFMATLGPVLHYRRPGAGPDGLAGAGAGPGHRRRAAVYRRR